MSIAPPSVHDRGRIARMARVAGPLLVLLLASAPTAAAQVLRYGGEPGTSRTYVRQQRDRVVQTVDGRQATTDIESYWRLAATVAAATPESLTIEIVHDSLALTGPPSTGDLGLAGLHGVPIEVVMTPQGAVREVDLPDSLPPAAARLDLEATYRYFFPRLPEGEAVEGTAWSDTIRVMANQNGLSLRVLRGNRYASKGWATNEEVGLVRVGYDVDVAIEGSGEQQEAGIVLSGSGSGSGVFDFDPEAGAYVGGSESTEMRMVALVTAQGQSILIPIVQSRTETVTSVAPAEPSSP